jgi:hypothetical protein
MQACMSNASLADNGNISPIAWAQQVTTWDSPASSGQTARGSAGTGSQDTRSADLVELTCLIVLLVPARAGYCLKINSHCCVSPDLRPMRHQNDSHGERFEVIHNSLF